MNKLIKILTKPIIYTIISYILLSPISPAIQVVNANNRAEENSRTETGSELSDPNTNDLIQNLSSVVSTKEDTNNDTGAEIHPSPIEFGTQEIEVCFVNLDEKGQVLDNLPRAVEFEFPIYTNPNVNKNTGLPDAYVESGSELNDSNTIKFNIDEETGNNEIIWTHSTSSGQANSGKNDAYCETHEIEVPLDTERRTYAYGEMTITDPLNDWFDTRYHDGYQEEFTHPKYAEKYSPELFELDENGNHIPNQDKHHGGDHNKRDNLSDGHINLYGSDPSAGSGQAKRRIVIVNKIKKRVLPKVIEVCFVTVDHYGNFIDGTKIENTNLHIRLHSDLETNNKGYPTELFGPNFTNVYLSTPYENNVNHFNIDDNLLLASESGSELPEEAFNDAHCKEVEFLTKNTHFGYSQLSINSTDKFEIPKYADQPGKYIKSIEEFTEYSHELFDSIDGNEKDREKNSDGHIVIRENEDPRKLMVMVKLIDNPHKMKIDVIDKYGNDIDGLEDDPANSISQTPAEYLDYDANESKKQLRYEIIDNNPEETKYVRFSWDGNDWKTINSLPVETWCPRSVQTGNFVDECNTWDGSAFTENLFKFEKEGKETRYVEITDEYGNVRVEALDIIFDMTNPAGDSDFFHGTEPYDTVNTDYIYERTSHTTYQFKDTTTSSLNGSPIAITDTSGIYKIRFGYENDETTMNSWVDYTQGQLETYPHSWVTEIEAACPDDDVNCDLDLDVYAQVMDRAGNISTIYHDRIVYRNYETSAPKPLAADETTVEGVVLKKNQILVIGYLDSNKDFVHVKSHVPTPKINSLEVSDDKTSVKISGDNLGKYGVFKILTVEGTHCENNFIYYDCKNLPYKIEDKKIDHPNDLAVIDHPTIRIMKSNSDSNNSYSGTEVGWTWSYDPFSNPEDSTDYGTWEVEIPIGKDNQLNLNDRVYAYSIFWDTLPGICGQYECAQGPWEYAEGEEEFQKSDPTKKYTIQGDPYDDNRNTGEENVNDSGVKLHGDPDLNGMDDVATTNVFFDYIKNLINDNVVNGYPDGKFQPDDNVTRGQMAKFIVNGFNIETGDCAQQDQFNDVFKNHTFFVYINAMKCAGIADGDNSGSYHPDKDLKRGEAAKLIVRAIEHKNKISLSEYYNTYHNYTDVSGHTFEEYIGYLFNTRVGGNKIMQGYSHVGGNRPFGPNDNITRGQMAKIIDLGRQFGFDDINNLELGKFIETKEVPGCTEMGEIDYYDNGEIHHTSRGTFVVNFKAYQHYINNGGFIEFGFATSNLTPWHNSKYNTGNNLNLNNRIGYIQNFETGFINVNSKKDTDDLIVGSPFTVGDLAADSVKKSSCSENLPIHYEVKELLEGGGISDFKDVFYMDSGFGAIFQEKNSYYALDKFDEFYYIDNREDVNYEYLLQESLDEISIELTRGYMRLYISGKEQTLIENSLKSLESQYGDMIIELDQIKKQRENGLDLLKFDYKTTRLLYASQHTFNSTDKADLDILLTNFFGDVSIKNNWDDMLLGAAEYMTEEGISLLIGSALTAVARSAGLGPYAFYGFLVMLVINIFSESIYVAKNYDLLLTYGEVPNFKLEDGITDLGSAGVNPIVPDSDEKKARLVGRGIAKVGIYIISILLANSNAGQVASSKIRNVFSNPKSNSIPELSLSKSKFTLGLMGKNLNLFEQRKVNIHAHFGKLGFDNRFGGKSDDALENLFMNQLKDYNEHEIDLGYDIDGDKFDVFEMNVAKKLEDRLGIMLTRDEGVDWKTGIPSDNTSGTTYDELISRTPSQHFDTQWEKNLKAQIDGHVVKADYAVIDFESSNLSPSQIKTVKDYIELKGYNDNFIFFDK